MKTLLSNHTSHLLWPLDWLLASIFADDRDPGIVCRTPPCHKDPPCFADIDAFERHHHQVHALACIECRLHFPTERILSLHLEERHDPFVEVQRANHKYKVLSVSTFQRIHERNRLIWSSINVLWRSAMRHFRVW